MPDKRYENRCKKRLKVRYGETKPLKLGYTEDVSHDGLFIRAVQVFKPGTHLHIEMTLSDGDTVLFEGVVRWAKKVPPTMISDMKGGMGIEVLKYDHGKEQFLALCPIPCGDVCEQPKTTD